jgi:hypothetical protein
MKTVPKIKIASGDHPCSGDRGNLFLALAQSRSFYRTFHALALKRSVFAQFHTRSR